MLPRPRTLLPCLLTAAVLALCGTADADPPAAARPSKPLPPPPAGVTHLELRDLFVKPVGPRGLTLTERVKGLDGKRVRVYGFMVQQEDPHPGDFLLTREPLSIIDHEGGLSDLPTDHVRVLVPGANGGAIPYTPRPLLLTGVLSVGNRGEPDGSVSTVRLTLDRPAPGGAAEPAKKNPKP